MSSTKNEEVIKGIFNSVCKIMLFSVILLIFLLTACEKMDHAEVRLRNTDPIHTFTEVKFNNSDYGELVKGETTNYHEIPHGAYLVYAKYFSTGTYWAEIEDMVMIPENGKYTIQINNTGARAVKD